jgi:hypothetical protein
MQRPERARGADVSLLTRISTKGKRKSQQETDLDEELSMEGRGMLPWSGCSRDPQHPPASRHFNAIEFAES